MQKPNKGTRSWEALVFRPSLPEGWIVEEQQINDISSSISFIKWGKKHQNSEPEKFYVVLNEFNPYNVKNTNRIQFTVRGGRYVKPSGDLKSFSNIKSAEDHIIKLCESTDKWLDRINLNESN